MRSLARSTTEVSREERKIGVVASLSWPIHLLMTERVTPLAMAADANEWRTTYMVSLKSRSTILVIFLRLRVMV